MSQPNRFLHADGAGSYSPPSITPARMDYFTLSKRFWKLDSYQHFGASATRLYLFLLEEFNKDFFPEQLTLSDATLILCLGTTANTLKKAREELVDRQVLAFRGGNNGRGLATVYTLPAVTEKVSKIDTYSAVKRTEKGSAKVSVSDTLNPIKGSAKVSEIDTLYKEETETSSVVETKTPKAPVGGGASSQEKLPSQSQALTSASSGGAALDEPQHQAARTLAAAIALNWQISEQKNFQKWAKIFRFCLLLAEAGQLDELARQFKAYHAYRLLRGIIPYNLDKYLGHEQHLSPSGAPFADGEWCGCEWPAKLQEEQQASLAKVASRPSFGPAPVAARVSGSYAPQPTSSPKL